MSDFEDIQRLIRLKRHENPPEDFVEDFVRSFQQRQRAELLQQSARGLLWERMTTYVDGLLSPKWGWATAAVAVVGVSLLTLKPSSLDLQGSMASNGHDTTVIYDSAMSRPISDEEVKEYLLSRHYDGIFGEDKAPSHSSDQQFASPVIQTDNLLPIGFKLDMPR